MVDLNRVKIGQICTIEKGSTGLAKALTGKYPLVATGADRKTSREYQFDTKAVCIPLVSSTGHGKKTLNYVHYQEGKFALGSILAAVIPKDEKVLSARYLHVYLQKNKDRVLVPLMKGAANVSLSIQSISNIEIPLPSIRKQAEIINKIDSVFVEHTGLSNELDIQVTLFGKLRQALLQEAIEGKLTAEWRKQNPKLISGDNHASNLLEKIRSEKDRLVKEAKIRKDKPFASISEDEKPFLLPDGWVWCRLGELATLITKGSSPNWQGIRYVGKGAGISFITSKNVGTYKIDLTDETFVEERFNEIEPRSILQRGDILTNIVGASIGRTAIYNIDDVANINQAVCLVRIATTYIDKMFLLHWMNSSCLVVKMHEDEFAPGRANLSMANVANFLVPIAPQDEQQAVNEQVAKIMEIINKLEEQVTSRKQQSGLLMRSVLQEAFA